MSDYWVIFNKKKIETLFLKPFNYCIHSLAEKVNYVNFEVVFSLRVTQNGKWKFIATLCDSILC